MEKPSEGQQHYAELDKVDLKAIFDHRLKDVGPTPENDLRFDGYENAAIGEIKKEIPAIVIKDTVKDEYDDDEVIGYNLWITDPIVVNNKREPHVTVREEFDEVFGGGKAEKVHKLAAWLLEDAKGDLSLLLDEMRAEDFSEEDDLEFLEFLRRYNISKVVGFFHDEDKRSEHFNKGITLINEDMIATSREDLYLLNIAQEHGMTNSQFLRLRQRAHSDRDAQIAFDATKLAQEIVGEEGHL